jgi:hydroxymethylbilane synthase
VTRLRLGTRGSKLALWQAHTVAQRLAERAEVHAEIVIIRTSGDESSGPPESPVAGSNVKGMFVKEIEDALLTGDIDLAVHSSKDLSAEFPAGLIIAGTLAREDARDALLLPGGARVSNLEELVARAKAPLRVGTSSVRRAAQLYAIFAGAEFVAIRGNVDTRLRKLDAGECDVLVLACAGLKRLGLHERISFALPADVCVPAPGQGIVSIQVREDAADARPSVAAINDRDAFDALTAERAVVAALGGGCQMPLGAHAQLAGDDLSVTAVVTSADGTRSIRRETRGLRQNARAVGEALAQSLIDAGALQILGG